MYTYVVQSPILGRRLWHKFNNLCILKGSVEQSVAWLEVVVQDNITQYCPTGSVWRSVMADPAFSGAGQSPGLQVWRIEVSVRAMPWSTKHACMLGRANEKKKTWSSCYWNCMPTHLIWCVRPGGLCMLQSGFSILLFEVQYLVYDTDVRGFRQVIEFYSTCSLHFSFNVSMSIKGACARVIACHNPTPYACI